MPTLITDQFKPTDNKPVHEFVEKPKVVPVDYQGAVVDNRYDRLDTLLQYADGSPTEVIYFRQRLGKDDTVTEFSLDLSAPYQQYERVDGFEILMQSGLATSNSGSDIRTTEVTGEAYVRQPLIPNVGDVFLMDFGRGTLGWFKVNASRRLTHRKNTLYEIQFSLVYEITDQVNDKRMINLNSKVVEVFKYSGDYLRSGQNPLVSPKKAELLTELYDHYHRLKEFWFRKFYSRIHETCFVPNQDRLIYDGFYMKNIRKWFSSGDLVQMQNFKILDDSQFAILKNPSIWDVISKQDKYMFRSIFTEAVSVGVDSFTNVPQFASIRYSGFSHVIMPVQIEYSNAVYLDRDVIMGKARSMGTSVNAFPINLYEGLPLINQVIMAKSYVFSKDFYMDSVDGQSHLEIQLRKYIEDSTLNMDVIEALAKDCHCWGELEQYYYIPTLMVLINYGIRRMNANY